jgi:1,4-dihydroxy-6-naphthoate synthase
MTLAFSPCPNDTFIFDALVNNKIDTEGLQFEVMLEDVETLNKWALQGKIDFTKISYGVLPLILNNYKVLQSGGALGKGVGPLLIGNSNATFNTQNETLPVAIPGENTTAHLLFSLAYKNTVNKKFMVFNQIESYVLNNPHSMGVIIHENRFTYQQKGLHKVLDLGAFWEQCFNLPIPLGGIVAHNKIDKKMALKVDRLIQKSVQYAFNNYPLIANYVKQHSQEMEVAVMQQHIDLYVNNFSLGLGNDGQNAVIKLLKTYQQLHTNVEIDFSNIFIDNCVD